MVNSGTALKGWVSLEVFAQTIFQSGQIEQAMKDLLVWWEHRHDDDILLVFYDDLN